MFENCKLAGRDDKEDVSRLDMGRPPTVSHNRAGRQGAFYVGTTLKRLRRRDLRKFARRVNFYTSGWCFRNRCDRGRAHLQRRRPIRGVVRRP